jgi:serine/threonine protein kinase
LLSEKDEVKISDFGLGTYDIEVQSKSGTKGYISPEAKNP